MGNISVIGSALGAERQCTEQPSDEQPSDIDPKLVELSPTNQLFTNLKRAILHVGKQYEQHTLIYSDIEKMYAEFDTFSNHLCERHPSYNRTKTDLIEQKLDLFDLKCAMCKVCRKYNQDTLNSQDVVQLYITFADFSFSMDDLLIENDHK